MHRIVCFVWPAFTNISPTCMVRNWKGFASISITFWSKELIIISTLSSILNSCSLSILLFRSRFFCFLFDYADNSLKKTIIYFFDAITFVLFNGRFSKENIDSDRLFWSLYFSKLKYLRNILEKYKKFEIIDL